MTQFLCPACWCCVMSSCRAGVRSEARYIASFEPTVTSGTGFVSSLSLIAKIGKHVNKKWLGCKQPWKPHALKGSLQQFAHAGRADLRSQHAQTDARLLVPLYLAESGMLRYLQWYNLTCNDCGGRTSSRCLNNTSCALSWQECTCDDTTAQAASSSSSSPAPSPSPEPSPAPAQGSPAVDNAPCSYANFSL